MWIRWDWLGGPGCYLGAPIGPEYLKNGLTVQDFLGGYVVWNGSFASDTPYPALYGPGGFNYSQLANEPELLLQSLSGICSNVGWSPTVSYLFVECYQKHGQGAALGYPTTSFRNQSVDANVSRWYVPGESRFYYVQRFSGGNLGQCLIMYDPQNRGSYNKDGENKAYLLKQGFLDYYLANNGIKMLGCPVSEEYWNQYNGLTYQDFQKGQLVWNGSSVSVQSHSPNTAYLWIDSDPAGSSVYVDGSSPYDDATTPTHLVGVTGGDHEVRIALVGEPEKTVTVTAIPDHITDVHVANQNGTVNIVSSPGNIQLYHTGGAPWPAE
ncbi:MAG: PEGA domain-containing protein, partial [Nitrospira sp.]|nr:PEGA domain-containing protein [Nitrospira sp.]